MSLACLACASFQEAQEPLAQEQHLTQSSWVQRAKELVEESFNGIVAALEPPLSSSLAAAKQAEAVRIALCFTSCL